MKNDVIIDTDVFKFAINALDEIRENCDSTVADNTDNKLDKTQDIIKIIGSNDNPITFDDIFDAFEKIDKQIAIVMKDKRFQGPLYGTDYTYIGIIYSKKKKMYRIQWSMG